MNPEISLLLPTRGRPLLVERFFASVIKNTHNLNQIEIIMYVDDDDTESHQLDSGIIAVTKIIGPRLTMGQFNTACLEASRGSIIMLVNDDVVIKTNGWDNFIVNMDMSFPDKIYLAYVNDNFKKSKVSTFPILSRKTCELLGNPFPKEYQGAFIDYHLFDIFKRIQHTGFNRIHYLEDVIFEHLHYRTGKAMKDETYCNRNRFADDNNFINLIDLRRASSNYLLHILNHEPVTTFIPSQYTPNKQSTSLIGSIYLCTKKILFDWSLPTAWRFNLWIWLILRFIASKTPLNK